MIGMIECGKCGNVWGLFLAYFIVHILYTEIPFFIHSKNRASCLLNKRGVGSFKRICPHPVDNCCVKKKVRGIAWISPPKTADIGGKRAVDCG